MQKCNKSIYPCNVINRKFDEERKSAVLTATEQTLDLDPTLLPDRSSIDTQVVLAMIDPKRSEQSVTSSGHKQLNYRRKKEFSFLTIVVSHQMY